MVQRQSPVSASGERNCQASLFLGFGQKLQQNNNALQDALKGALRARGLPENTPLLDPNFVVPDDTPKHTCRVFVLAMHPGEIHIPLRLRSYTSRMNPVTTDCSLWEAAMASEASPTRYAPVLMGSPQISYISAALGFCNPSKEALDEAVRIWQLSGIRCLVSLGAGKKPPVWTWITYRLDHRHWNYPRLIR